MKVKYSYQWGFLSLKNSDRSSTGAYASRAGFASSRINLIRLMFVLPAFIITFSSCATAYSVKRTTLKSRDIPESFEGYRIVFLTDLHLNRLLKENYYKRVIERCVKLKPDLILLGGDFVDENTEDMEKALDLLKPLTVFPCVAVLGNHDNWISGSGVTEGLRRRGVAVLRNENLVLKRGDDRIVIAGVADRYSDRPDLSKVLGNVNPEDFCILLSHSPELWKQARTDNRVDLMLSGHTHGGQVTLFGLWAPVLPLNDRTWWRGHYKGPHGLLIISNGIGVYSKPVRVFASPAVELIILVR